MGVSFGEIDIVNKSLIGEYIMKTKMIIITIVALMSITFLTGCGNPTDYNNRTSVLWGLLDRTSSGGEGTDDAPALNDPNPNTNIEQRGGKSWN